MAAEAAVVREVGDCALLIEVSGSAAALALAGAVRELLGGRLLDVVPGHRTVLVRWAAGSPAPALPDWSALLTQLPASAPAAAEILLEVDYDGDDLGSVAAAAGVSVEELVRRHTRVSYRVAFLGFAPGFAYMTGGDPLLALPRRAEPRSAVPAGSVAIAGPYCAVYPAASPGGWHLLGRTAAVMFDARREPPALLEPGTRVRFEARR